MNDFIQPISHVFVCSWLPVHKHLNRGPTSGFVPSSSSEQPNTTMPRSGQIRYYSQAAAAAAAGTSVGRSGNDDVFMNENHGHNEWSNETKSKSCCSLVVRFLLSLSLSLSKLVSGRCCCCCCCCSGCLSHIFILIHSRPLRGCHSALAVSFTRPGPANFARAHAPSHLLPRFSLLCWLTTSSRDRPAAENLVRGDRGIGHTGRALPWP